MTTHADALETFRFVRKDTLDDWPPHLTGPLLALSKTTRQALGMVLDCTPRRRMNNARRKAPHE